MTTHSGVVTIGLSLECCVRQSPSLASTQRCLWRQVVFPGEVGAGAPGARSCFAALCPVLLVSAPPGVTSVFSRALRGFTKRA